MSNPNIELLKKYINDHFEKLNSLVLDNISDTKNSDIENPENNDDKIFYVYTTGMANAGANDVIDFWEQCRYTNIIKQIPDYFNLIIIEHYDSISNKKIVTVIDEQDKNSLPTKRTKQTFINKNFNFSDFKTTNKHYIILDFAHILHYCYNKISKEYYMVDDNNNKFKLNCIYIDFPNHTCLNNYKENIPYFHYDTSTEIFTSYIELFFTKCNHLYNEFIVEVYGIIDIEKKLIDKILKPPIFNLLKNATDADKRKQLFDIIDNLNKLNDLYKEFFNKLFASDNLFDSNKLLITPEYTKFIDKINAL